MGKDKDNDDKKDNTETHVAGIAAAAVVISILILTEAIKSISKDRH